MHLGKIIWVSVANKISLVVSGDFFGMFELETLFPSSATLELENRLADFSPKSAQNTQSLRVHPELRSPSKPFTRSVSSTQSTIPSSLAMLDEVPVSSGSKKLGRPRGICGCCMDSLLIWLCRPGHECRPKPEVCLEFKIIIQYLIL